MDKMTATRTIGTGDAALAVSALGSNYGGSTTRPPPSRSSATATVRRCNR